ncbi:hypothetical protein [[Phormidium] sp. ETS-05]|uniref:hypothetical protein n=1 Tax=[Phormidium] sp. ETS-05 TaxID=222819 RepID=UPI0018EF0DA8|nr:hypothetical protein [[Phormidium] sp. ETS-05]
MTSDKIELEPNIIEKNPVITRDKRIGYARLPKILLQSQPESPACRVIANDKAGSLFGQLFIKIYPDNLEIMGGYCHIYNYQ